MIYTGRFRGAKVFKKENRQPVFHAAKSDETKIGKSAVLRRHGLRRLISDIEEGVAKMSVVLEVPENRVVDVLEGKAHIDDGMAMHIEEMLRLSAGWLESQDGVPDEVKERLSHDVIALIAEKADDEHGEDANLGGDEDDDWIFGEAVATAGAEAGSVELSAFEQHLMSAADESGAIEPASDSASENTAADERAEDPRAARRAEALAEERERGLRATRGLLKISESFPGLRGFLVKHAVMSEPTASRILGGDYPTKARRRGQIEAILGLDSGELEAVSRDTIAKIFEGVATQNPELHQRVRRGRPLKHQVAVMPPAAPVYPEGIQAGEAETDAQAVEPKVDPESSRCGYLDGVPAYPPIHHQKAMDADASADDLAGVFLRRFERAREEGQITDQMAYEMLGMLLRA